ncbi:MAG TPA: hypothetical protein VKC64_06005 [Burkholderiales bacterium]|nr:hypothetical protein [Burkholderiales bacterium]
MPSAAFDDALPFILRYGTSDYLLAMTQLARRRRARSLPATRHAARPRAS